MTDLLYQSDSYLKEFEATVVGVYSDDAAIAFDRTAFYPGGGQPNDVGILIEGERSVVVTKVKRDGQQLWHWIDEALPAIGITMMGQLDWDRRFKLMRTHTALHVLCVANTQEVGKVRIVDYKSKGKINKQVHLQLDE